MNILKWLQSFDGARLRRWLIAALGGGERFTNRAKLLFSLLIFLLSFSIKSLVAVDLSPVLYTVHHPAIGMAWEYHQEAVSINKGHGLLIPDNWDPADTTLLRHSPGYSIYLAAIYFLFDDNYFTVQLIQNAMNSLSAVLIFLIAGNLLTWPVGAGAGLLAALSHHFSYYSNFILPDSICALPLLMAFYLLVTTERRQKRSPWVYVVAGVLIGLSTWLRPNALLLGPFLAVLLSAISVRRWQAAKRAWIVAVMPFLIVAPITIRNYMIFGEFVPISANTGIVLWEGIADGGGERFGAVNDDGQVAHQEAALYDNPIYALSWATPDGIKRDRDRIKRSLDVIVRNPTWFAGVMFRRMGQMFKYSAQAPLVFKSTDTELKEAGEAAMQRKDGGDYRDPNGEEKLSISKRAIAYGEAISWTRPVMRALQRIAKESMLLFILLGAIALFFLSARRALYVMIVPFYYLLIQSTMHTEFRYTLPMHYFIFIFAAAIWVLLGRAAWIGAKRLSKSSKGGMSMIRRYLLRTSVTALALILVASSIANGQSTAQPRRDAHVIMISIDGLVPDYYTDAAKLGLRVPTLTQMKLGGAYAEGVEGVYPSVTYPAHTTLITGVRPAIHGIIQNRIFEAPTDPQTLEWYWFAEALKSETLWSMAKKAGLVTANVGWPVTVGADIDYNMPEIKDPKEDPPTGKRTLQYSTPGLIAKAIAASGSGDTSTDGRRTAVCEYIINTYKPNLLLVHLLALDDAHHKHGLRTPPALETAERMDAYIGRIVEATRKAGIFDQTTFFLVSDHGFAEVKKKFEPNVVLVKEKLITLDAQDKPTDWKAAAWPSGGSCAVVLRDPNDKETANKVLAIFNRIAASGNGPINRVLTREDIKRLQSIPTATLMLDAAPGYSFDEKMTGPDIHDPKDYRGTHGQLPSRAEMRSSLIIFGAGARAGAKMALARMIDIAPTAAALLGLSFADAEGRAIEQLLKPGLVPQGQPKQKKKKGE